MSAPMPPDPQDSSTTPEASQKRAKRKRLVLIATVGLVAIGVLYGAWALLFAGKSVTTDNAYTAAEVAQITPLVAGPVKEVKVSDTQAVKAGDVLVILDDTDAKIAVAQAEADLARTQRQVRQLLGNDESLAGQVALRAAEIATARSDLTRVTAAYEKAVIDERRRQNLVEEGAVSKEELTNAQTQLREARAALEQAQAQVRAAEAAKEAASGARTANSALIVDSTVDDNPAVLAAKARLDQARVNLERTVLRAPFDGVIAQRSVEIGQQVQTGVRLMTVVPIDRIYVDANFKEGQLQKVRPGQHVELTSDLYGSDVVYTGRVEGFAGGSGSAFAAIPAQNATGNWIKVVQRLPVRIWIDPEQLKQHPLRVGLSMEATVDLRDHGESQPVATR
ncbi:MULTISPECIES: HlyD family efflux transporter periplasmic adaptor subunit [Pseudomonas]|uniref:HlyD family efflux transporter periplasmic adaptor subunit n=1 Tax=Pseudomonas TaxID=286 RepID=UPI00053E0346|nr:MULTISPECIES: HlyD family efflux transporter periplasmic adaptor subunit [Pseudomonas]KSR67346.1 EmrA/EmrK family multidrug efflux transporter periplasmic adaptor subunit [Pseudomonas aeruginosa]MBF2896394.1 HlyD family efflux transporter periplasmic adaptor subunit [Pseudomonas aeruginosa]MBF2928171.1 HlyD family efflux transporter periplasmic adaptor subunit [Pseudomonas aeruginosa]MBF2940330.1 HlyD family efflux transporter periplasmic adaptor subunit [Pseudomonas aeruginosa]MBF2954498.1